ncbi:MAG: hypothetical protein R3Y27_04240 [Clostridia bacterium]
MNEFSSFTNDLKTAKTFVKSNSKKALSVLLALVMMLSTCSAAFAVIALAANRTEPVNSDAISQLVDLLEDDATAGLLDKFSGNVAGITYTQTKSGSDGSKSSSLVTLTSYTDYLLFNEIVKLVLEAADYCVFYRANGGEIDHKYDGYASDPTGDRKLYGENMSSIFEELTSRLSSAFTKSSTFYTDNKIETLVDVIFNSWSDHDKVSKKNYDDSTYGQASVDSGDLLTFTLTVYCTDILGWIEFNGGENYADIKLQTVYNMYMHKVSASGSSCGTTYSVAGYLFTADTDIIGTPAVSVGTAGAKLITAADAYKNAIQKAYADYPTFESVYDYFSNDSVGCTAYISELTTYRNAVKTLIGDSDSDQEDEKAILAAMVGTQSEDCFENFNAMLTIHKFDTAAKDWADFAAANPSYGEFDSLAFGDGETLKAEHETFTNNIYAIMTSSTTSLFDFFVVEYNLDANYYVEFSDNVDAYKANDIKTALDNILEQYASADLTTLPEEEKSAVYTLVDGYLATLSTYSDKVIAAENIFNNDLDKYYDIEAEFECEINLAVNFFITMGTANYAKYSTSELLAIFAKTDEDTSKFDSYYADLDILKAKLTESAGEEKANELLTPVYAYADGLQAAIYDYLGSRFEGQVAYALDIYTSMGVDYVDAKNYMNLKSSVGAIDTAIYITFSDGGGADYAAYVNAQTHEDYAYLLSTVIPQYEAVGESLGYSVYNQTDVEYEVRDYYEGIDTVKDETTNYEVDDETLNELITTLDKLLQDERILALVTELIGVDLTQGLSELVKSLLEDMLFTDDIINMIFGVLYPLVSNEFAIDLPSSVNLTDSITISVSYNYDMPGIAYLGDMAITPMYLSMLLKEFSGNTIDYTAAIAQLEAAGHDWQSAEIYDAETKSYTINWGVDELMAQIDAGTYTGSMTKSEIFADAIGTSLQGLYPLLGALLCGDAWDSIEDRDIADAKYGIISVTVYLDLTASSNDGYVNALGVIYDALGYTDYATTTQIASQVTDAVDFANIFLDDIYGLLDYIFSAPVENILDAIPNLVYALEFDFIPQILGMLKTTISYTAVAMGYTALSDTIVIDLGPTGGMLNLASLGLDTSGGLASILDLVGFELAGLDTGTLGTLGELKVINSNSTASFTGLDSGKAYHIEADTEGVLYYLVTFIINSIKVGDFYNVIGAFVDDTSAIEDFIVNNLGFSQTYVSSGDVVAALCELFDPYFYGNTEYFSLGELKKDVIIYTDASGADHVLPDGYVFDSETQTFVEVENPLYTQYWTQEKAEYVTQFLPEYIEGLAAIFGYDIGAIIGGSVSDLLATLYTTENLQAILDLIAPYLDMVTEDETIAMIVESIAPFIDDVDVQAIINHIATFEIAAFENGDRDAFVAELVRLIAPLTPVLKFFLVSDEGISVYDDAIAVNSYDGYTSAILPIFEAMGCTADTMVNASELAAIEDESEFIMALLNPILGLIDTVVSDELVYSVLQIAPNILYFIEQGGLNIALGNLLRPVYAALDTVRPIYDVQFTIDINLTSIIDSLLADIKIDGFVIPSFTNLVSAIMTCGETEKRTSVSEATYNYVVIDEEKYPELLTVVLYEVIEGVTITENITPYINIVIALTDFLPQSETLQEMKELLTAFSELESPDQVLFVIYYVIYGVEVAVDSFEDCRDLVGKQLEAVFELIGGFESETYVEIADATNDLLDKLEQQLEDLGASEGSLSFFKKIVTAIRDFFVMLGQLFRV